VKNECIQKRPIWNWPSDHPARPASTVGFRVLTWVRNLPNPIYTLGLKKRTDRSCYRWIDQLIHCGIDRSIDRSCHWWIDQVIHHGFDRSISWSMLWLDRSTTHVIARSIHCGIRLLDQSHYWQIDCSCFSSSDLLRDGPIDY
jgi:hypothetical protein